MARQIVLLFVLVASVSALIWPFNKIFGSSNATTTLAPEPAPSADQPPHPEGPSAGDAHPTGFPERIPPGAQRDDEQTSD
ncbi:hypothetical protein ANCCAN_07134 [Ancylostoma caninum]|uniref:Secreted protein n=1 Tax=Ancylostoma caninum TaxID=29170 RepID=A0A368GUW8_ANCCA|nr:hypothetical protein ANCCAN_07134 [Ancylostoma caninum]